MLPLVEKYKILARCGFWRKTQLFQSVQNFLLRSSFLPLKIIFPDSALRTEYRPVIKSTQNFSGGGASNRVGLMMKNENY
jgi:hypothetical protein